MKTIKKISLLTVAMISLATVVLTSCEWDNSPDYDHPTYVSYTITAFDSEYSGPDQFLTDIRAWIKVNSDIYDTQLNYSSGAASEFAKTDAAALKRYEDFLSRFKAYLSSMYEKLASGTYGKDFNVRASFIVYGSRDEGEEPILKSDLVTFAYPATEGSSE